jgi:hypothetical protein
MNIVLLGDSLSLFGVLDLTPPKPTKETREDGEFLILKNFKIKR